MHTKDNYPSGWHRIAPWSLYRNLCHVCIGMIWWSSLHTWRHMGGNSTDLGIWRQGPHSSPGSPQAPYKCNKNISHEGTDQTLLFRLFFNNVFQKHSINCILKTFFVDIYKKISLNCTVVSSSPAMNVLQDVVSFRGRKSNPDKATRQTTCPVMVTE